MRGSQFPGATFRVCAIVAYLLLNSLLSCALARGQEAKAAAQTAAAPDATSDLRALADAVRGLQAQVQTLSSQVSELRTDEQRWHAEARELRSELEVTRAQLASHPNAPDNDVNNSSNNSLEQLVEQFFELRVLEQSLELRGIVHIAAKICATFPGFKNKSKSIWNPRICCAHDSG